MSVFANPAALLWMALALAVVLVFVGVGYLFPKGHAVREWLLGQAKWAPRYAIALALTAGAVVTILYS